MDHAAFERYARLAVAALLALGCYYVLQPFIGAILFAAVLCFSTWPLFTWMRARLGGREWLASLLLVVLMLVAIAAPVALAAQSLVVHSPAIIESFRDFVSQRTDLDLPDFIVNLPVVGSRINDYWQVLMRGSEEMLALAKHLADPAKALLVAIGAGIGNGLIQVLIAIFVSFFFYRDGERVRGMLDEAMLRIAGKEQGERIMLIAQNAVRGVVYGLLGTALAQGLVAVVGFLIAGVPGAVVLGALTFILSLVPMGPILVWGSAAAWLYFTGSPGWALFMVIYGVAVISSVDNFVKPILMSRAGGLSMLLVVLGVFGGAIAFGFIGLFVGPALLAIGWSIMKAWVEEPAQVAQGDGR
ncbi:MAG TPA: AI-2E family transporter [Usitatibacter sp.]|jgi:predicted PurR-regulated permease PerM|nr:AI-2E family transporter [Usitatibacter sp.]